MAERGRDYSACFSCPEFSKCSTGQNLYCAYNRETNQAKLRNKKENK